MWLKWTKSHQRSVLLLDGVNMGLMYVFNPLMGPCLIPLNPFCTWWMLLSWAVFKPWLIVNSILKSLLHWGTYWNWVDLCFHHSEVLTLFRLRLRSSGFLSLLEFQLWVENGSVSPQALFNWPQTCVSRKRCVSGCWLHCLTRKLSDVNPILLTVLPKRGWCITEEALPKASHQSSWPFQHRRVLLILNKDVSFSWMDILNNVHVFMEYSV